MTGRWVVCALTIVSASARADGDAGLDVAELDLDALLNAQVTTASKVSERVEDAPGSITVITRQQIEDLNARSLRDLLNVLVPGMDVVPTTFKFGDNVDQGIYSRGLPSDFSQQVLVLFNGQAKFNETTFSSTLNLPELTLENVERIELSRSPIPLYGGGAVTVINVITREQTFRGAEGAVDLQVMQADDFPTGGQNGKRFTGLFGADLTSWHVGGSVQYYDARGQQLAFAPAIGGPSPFPDATLRNGVRDAANCSLAASTLNGRFSAQMLLSHSDRDPFLTGFSANPNLGPYGLSSTQWVTIMRYRPTENLEISNGNMYSTFSEAWNQGGTPYGGELWNNYDNLEVNYHRKLSLLGDHQTLAGAKFEYEGQYDGKGWAWNGSGFVPSADDSTAFVKSATRNVVSIFAEDNWRPRDDLSVLAGVRGDEYLGFGSSTELAVNPRLAATWTQGSHLVLKLLYASALRPPALYESGGTLRPPLLGTPGIRSEQVRTLEAAAILRAGGLKVQVTPHLEVVKDAIVYVPVGPNFVAQNTGSTEVQGLDVDAWYYFDARNYLFANQSYLHSYNVASGAPTPFLPSEYLNAGGNWNWRSFDACLTASLRGPRAIPEDLASNRTFNHTTLYLTANLSYAASKSTRFYFMVQNLTNQPNWIPLAKDGFMVRQDPHTFHVGMVYTLG